MPHNNLTSPSSGTASSSKRLHPPPRKRARLSEKTHETSPNGQQAELNNFSRHQRLWWEDGNVILVAGSVGFRVHRSILGRQSSTLCNVLVSGYDTAERTEGCPIVRLSDNTEDATALLSALYNTDPYRAHRQRMSLSFAASLLRITHKYDVADLRQDALTCFKSFYPITLSAWLNVEYVKPAPNAVLAVNLAHFAKIPSILPAALLHCMQLDPDVLIQGWHRPDGTVEFLSPEDTVHILQGRDSIWSDRRTAPWLLHPQCSSKCSDQTGCTTALSQLPQDALREGYFHHVWDLSNPCDSQSWPSLKALCRACKCMMRANFNRINQATWRNLPAYFNLPPLLDWG